MTNDATRADAGVLPKINHRKNMEMNGSGHTAAAPEGQTEPASNQLGSLYRTDATYAVFNLSSVFTVCSMALDSVGEYRADIRERAIEDIKHTLQLGALLAEDVGALVSDTITRLGGDQ